MSATPSTTEAILQVEHLSMKFGGLVAIGDLSFQAKRGEITALIGPNGAGKTTVFNCITGFYKPTEGAIRFINRSGQEFPLERMPDFQITAKAKVARTFQNIRLFSGMTLLENLLVAQHNKLMKASGFTVLGLLGFSTYRQASKESVELAKYWLEKADLVERADDPAGDLPYGAQRRLEIARAMCTGPEFLCLDEPAAGLNPKESLALNTLLMDIKNNTGTSILLIEHDMSVVMQISDHVVVLEYGRKISDGDPTFVKTDPRVIAAYLGVDDEEVTDVLAEVGDEAVVERLDAHPDLAHGPESSASMFAGPVTDTIAHSEGEMVTVSKGASKADIVEARERRRAAEAGKAKAGPKASAKPKPAPKATAAPTKSEPVAVAKAPAAKPALKAPAAAKPAPKASATPAYGIARTVKPAEKSAASKPAAAKAPAAKAPAAKAPAAKAPASKAAAPAKPAAARAPAAPKDKKIANTLAAPRGGVADRLILIKGIGPVNEKKLNEHGIFHFDQIAAWTKSDIEAAEAYLAFDGRIAREDWIVQAKALAKGAPKTATTKPAGSKRGGSK